jgi:hypothetical protein
LSYTEKGSNLVSGFVPADRQWRAVGIPRIGEVVVSAAETSPRRKDGHGTQTGYAFTRIPDDLVRVLRKQHDEGEKFGGIVSLSAVTMLASAMEAVGATKKARTLRKYYSDIVNELGLGKMATTWGQGAGKIPGLRHLSPERQLAVFKKELGVDTVVYSKSPEEWAHLLPPDISSLLEEK